jgi:hypothetical protein
MGREQTEKDIEYFISMGIDPKIGDIMRNTPYNQLADFYFDPHASFEDHMITKLGFHMEGTPLESVVKMPVTEDAYSTNRHQRLIHAADYGSNDAAYELANNALMPNQGNPQNFAEAVKWLELCASRNDPYCLHNLGLFAHDGIGMTADPVESSQYYLRAAKLGFASSQNNIGWDFYKGDGVPKSIPDAVFWITRSAEHGEPFAYGSLCEMYDAGDVFLKDDIEAFKWCRLAVDQEPDGLVRDNDLELLRKLVHDMNVDDIKMANDLASKWKPIKPAPSQSGLTGDD